MPADSVPSKSNVMDSNLPENVLGTSPGASSLLQRNRTESEGSESGMRFVLPSVDGSPPKVVTLNEVADVVKKIQKMEMVHEMVLNPEYKLQPYEPPENSLERRIKDIMHKVFWDNLREQLEKTPPCYDFAIQLLSEIKECFPQIIPQTNQRALSHLNEILDEALIRQQAEKGVLDFKAYSKFVINIMEKSCAPARDEAVAQLNQIDDVVDTFRGILEVMSLMKLDMANFLLDSARNDIMMHSVEYEKEKFKEYLEYYKLGFPATESWLKRNCIPNSNGTPPTVDQTIWTAYLELMNWNEDNEFPELLSIDKERILKLGQRGRRLCVCASINAITSAIPIISQRPENRALLAKEIAILLQDCSSDTEINDVMPSIWEHIKAKVNEFLTKENQTVMDAVAENTLKAQILQLANKDSKVRMLMYKRLQTYFLLISRCKNALPQHPPGYLEYKDELEAYATALKLVISYNHSVFGEYLMQILTEKQRNDAAEAGGNSPNVSNDDVTIRADNTKSEPN